MRPSTSTGVLTVADRHNRVMLRSLSLKANENEGRVERTVERSRQQEHAEEMRQQARERFDAEAARRANAHSQRALRMFAQRVAADGEFREFAQRECTDSLSRSRTVGDLNLAGHRRQTARLHIRQGRLDAAKERLLLKIAEREREHSTRLWQLEQQRAAHRNEGIAKDEEARQQLRQLAEWEAARERQTLKSFQMRQGALDQRLGAAAKRRELKVKEAATANTQRIESVLSRQRQRDAAEERRRLTTWVGARLEAEERAVQPAEVAPPPVRMRLERRAGSWVSDEASARREVRREVGRCVAVRVTVRVRGHLRGCACDCARAWESA